MLKQAWRSYLASLHPRNIKKLRESMTYAWLYIFFLLLYGMTSLLQDNGYADVICSTFLRMLLPLGLMGWSNLGSKYLMSKSMFLSPMKKEERKEYLNCVLVIKIGAMLVVAILVELVWSIFYGFKLWEILLISFLYLSIGIAEYAGYEVKRDENGRIPSYVTDKFGKRVPIWMNTALTTAAIVPVALFTAYDLNNFSIEKDFPVLIIFIACFIMVVFLDMKIIKEQYQYVIEQSSDYELHINIKGKVEKSKKYDLFAK